MIDFINKTDFKFDISSLENIYKYLTNKDVELILTTDEEIKLLNKKHRQKNNPTDVLSFPLENFTGMPLGSIVISIDTAQKGAIEYGHETKDEIKLLFIHGLLHLLGFNHETDNGEMRKKEKEIIEKFSLPKSLIVRNENN